jgi:photosystem II stability/assembly factor-like uncharacterized protein
VNRKHDLLIFLLMVILICGGCHKSDFSTKKSNIEPTNTLMITSTTKDPPSSTITKANVIGSPNDLHALQSAEFVDAGYGWVADHDKIYRTSDGGMHWRLIYKSEQQIKKLSFATETNGWMLMNDVLYQSQDSGISWSKLTVPENLTQIENLNFIDSLHGWLTSKNPDGHQLWGTQDGGKIWKKVPLPSINDIKCLFIAVQFIAVDEGWTLCGAEPATAMQEKTLFHTIDGGKHWIQILVNGKNELTWSGHVQSLNFINSQEGWIGLNRAGILHTIDGGKTWRVFLMLGDFTGETPLMVTKTKGYALWQNQLLKTDNAGKSWTQIYPAEQPNNHIQFYKNKEGVGASSFLSPKALFRTADAGATWTTFGTSTNLSGSEIISSSFINTTIGWILLDNQLYQTVNTGQTWNKKSLPLGDSHGFSEIDFINEITGYISNGYGHLYRTDDGGDSWLLIDNTDSDGRGYYFIDKMTGWRLIDHGLEQTKDGGKSWRKLQLPQDYIVLNLSVVTDGQELWITGGMRENGAQSLKSMILHSKDGGMHWEQYDFGGLRPESITFVDILNGWLLTGAGQAIYQTTNGGITWTKL